MAYVVLTALGLAAIVTTVPFAFDALRVAGAAYLLWLAWQAVGLRGRGPARSRRLAPDGPRRLFAMGLLTNLLNPNVAVLYLSLLPQFIGPDQGSLAGQILALGTVHVVIGVGVSAVVVASAGAVLLAQRPVWANVRAWMVAATLGGRAVHMMAQAGDEALPGGRGGRRRGAPARGRSLAPR